MNGIWRVMVVAALLPAASAAAGTSGVTQDSVDKAIAGCVKYLYSMANTDGIWDGPRPGEGTGVGAKAQSWGGKTALVLHALAIAGEQEDPRFKKAVKWLMIQKKIIGTYPVSCRLQLIHALPQLPVYRQVLRRDANLLVAGCRMKQGRATWTYRPPPWPSKLPFGDFSNNNYAVLGLWAASDERYEVPDRIWRGLEKAWTSGQHPDGGWSYRPADDPTAKANQLLPAGGMTTAGIASLYLVIDRLYARKGAAGSFRNTAAYQSIRRGLEWMEKNFSASTNPGRPRFFDAYYFYNCERVAAATGLKFFGTHDWFREISANLIRRQQTDGSIPYGDRPAGDSQLTDTAFSLLFLAKGSAPIIYNKLQHSGDWDNHIRELAALTGWLARQSERPANWQVVNLKGAPEELTDSRILYITGAKPLELADEELAKLKRFVEMGGLLVFHADVNGRSFAESARRLSAQIWPQLEFKTVDMATHPLGGIHTPLTDKRIRLEELAAPTRVMALLVLNSPAAAWEQRKYETERQMFALGADMHYFANDLCLHARMPTKLRYFGEIFRAKRSSTSRSIPLARIRYSDNPHVWDPEPLAFERFRRLLAARERIDCRVQTVTPDKLAASGAKIAHLAGVDASAVKACWDAVDAWLQGGGTLIIDQAGGPRTRRGNAFDDEFREFIEKRYGDDALNPFLSTDEPAKSLGQVPHRHVKGLRRTNMAPRLEVVRISGRPAIIYTRLDLTCGLLGAPNPLACGADDEGAYRILSRLLVWLTDEVAPKAPPAK